MRLRWFSNPWRRVGIAMAVLSAGAVQPVHAIRVITTPLADLLPRGRYGIQLFALHEERSTDETRRLYRFDARLNERIEVGAFVIDPPNGPTTTQLNLQGLIVTEDRHRPTVSAGVWDLANIEKFSGQRTGGSFFLVASRTVVPARGVGKTTPPVKVNLGVGTNRLQGIFGGAVVPFTSKLGLHAEYAPRNLRLPNADGWNAGLYYFVTPSIRARASRIGGNPMLDVYFIQSLR
ncbi:MAG: hypothetical protein KY468_07865 [Armatimonadetes bacterium]|nr:hypothetical protein [Armatimonadota bacterium]